MVVYYNHKLKSNARLLRGNLTDAEALLWSLIRRKQLANIQFYRQKPIANYIVDFYASSVKLVVEVDGGQHFEDSQWQQDRARDAYLGKLGLKVLRFDNSEVLTAIDEVLEVIFQRITEYLRNPPAASGVDPLF